MWRGWSRTRLPLAEETAFSLLLRQEERGGESSSLLASELRFQSGRSLAWGQRDRSLGKGESLPAGLLPMVGKMPTDYRSA